MRWVIRVFMGLIVLVIGAVAVLFLLPADKIAALVTNQFEAATGRAMTLEGDVRPTLWPELGVNTGPVSIANADWSDSGPMLLADGLSIGVAIGTLFGGVLHVTRVEADAPKILLEVASDGRANWDVGGGVSAGEGAAGSDSGEPSAENSAPAFSLDKAVIKNASVTFFDHNTGNRTALESINATILVPDMRGPADLEMSASMNGQALSVDGTLGKFADFLATREVPVTADVKVGGSEVAFHGRASLNPVAAGGRIAADLSDMAAIYSLVGIAAADVSRGFGQSIGVAGDMTFTDTGGLTLRDGTIRLDQNTLNGAVDVAFADRPRITARLAGGALDFSAATGGGDGSETGSSGGGEASAGSGWSRDHIDVSALQSVDANISLTAQSLDLGLAKFDATSLVTRLEAGRAVTEIKQIIAYGGTMAGSVVVNSHGGLSARANMAGDGVALQPLLQQLAGYDRLLAAGDVTINLLGVGNDMHTLMNSLNGDGTLRLGKGELQGLDLVGMLRNLDASFVGDAAKTIFDSITGTFQVENGVMSNVDLNLAAPLLSATGSGNIGIGGQTLDYRVVPKLLESETNGGIAIPLKITGTWANPKFALDLKALAEQELADEVEAVKNQAEEAVVEKLNEELGVDVENLDNIEDTLKKELEERAAKGLLDLLGGN